MPQYDRISYEVTREAVWITLARPEELNLVDDRLFGELLDAFIRARYEDQSVVVLRGSGRLFSGGGNLKADIATKALVGGPDYIVEMYEHVYHEYPVFAAIENCQKTTIAAVNGDAWGASVDLIMMCDLVIAVRSARLSFAPGKWGLADSPNATRLAQRIGVCRAKDLLFTARQVTAEEAASIGLISRLSDVATFDADVTQLVEDVLTTSPTSREHVKRIINRALPAFSPEEHFLSATGPDFRDGVRAFSARQPTPWSAAGLRQLADQSDEGPPATAEALAHPE